MMMMWIIFITEIEMVSLSAEIALFSRNLYF